jgi:hypothetical protein
MMTKVSGIGMDYFFLLGYIIIISTGWQHMRKRTAQSAKRIAFLGLRFFAMRYALPVLPVPGAVPGSLSKDALCEVA